MSAAVPAGWMLVPLMPTHEMDLAGSAADTVHVECVAYVDAAIIYRAMLAAAPPPPANIGADSPSAREKALREAIAVAEALHDAADNRSFMAHRPSDQRAFNRDAECYGDVAAAIAALLATPAEGGSE